MKKEYLEPEIELICLNVADVIVTSGITLDEDELPLIPANL